MINFLIYILNHNDSYYCVLNPCHTASFLLLKSVVQ